jgi:hypothetical protein
MKTPILFMWIVAAGFAAGGTTLRAQDTAKKTSEAANAGPKKGAPAGVGNAAGAAANSAGSASTADRTELFRSMDLNGDGKISPDEFATYQSTHGGTGLAPAAAPPAAKAPASGVTPTPKPGPATKEPVKRSGDTGHSDALYNTAPETGRQGSEAGRPAR